MNRRLLPFVLVLLAALLQPLPLPAQGHGPRRPEAGCWWPGARTMARIRSLDLDEGQRTRIDVLEHEYQPRLEEQRDELIRLQLQMRRLRRSPEPAWEQMRQLRLLMMEQRNRLFRLHDELLFQVLYLLTPDQQTELWNSLPAGQFDMERGSPEQDSCPGWDDGLEEE